MLVTEAGHTKISGWEVAVEVMALLLTNSFMPLGCTMNTIVLTEMITLLSYGITLWRNGVMPTTNVEVVRLMVFPMMAGASCTIGMVALVLVVNILWNQRYAMSTFSRNIFVNLTIYSMFRWLHVQPTD